MKIAWLALIVAAVAAPCALGQDTSPAGSVEKLRVEQHTAGSQPREVEIRAWLSRTAVWIGDRVTYTVEIKCAPHIDILTDDLDKEKLHLEGFEVVAADAENIRGPSGEVTHRFRYELVTYEINAPILKIADIPLRYYIKSAGQRIDDIVPAGEARVPAAAVAFRSTIPEQQESYSIRDMISQPGLPALFQFLQPVGAALIIIFIAPVAFWGVALLRRRRQPKSKKKQAETQRSSRATLEMIKRMDASTEAERREAYSRLDSVLRGHLTLSVGLPANTLTAHEIEAELLKRGARLPVHSLSSVLKECELACFGPPARLPAPVQFQNAVQETEKILSEPLR